jgi:hypothetical protein
MIITILRFLIVCGLLAVLGVVAAVVITLALWVLG